ncbi:MAG: hypothetical protein CM15mP84_00040 [Cellvibrionales bacterium]|nr:MAG: hypothetical protein CM15mP84_00040 [Cellvibrionales bacterium]
MGAKFRIFHGFLNWCFHGTRPVCTPSRIQLAANITFHILFPTITIGLGWFLLFFRVRYTPKPATFTGSTPITLGQGVCADLRFGRRLRYYQELSVRHQLAGLYGAHRQYRVGPLPLRGTDQCLLEASFLASCSFGKQRVSNRTHLISTFLRPGTSLRFGSWHSTPGCIRPRAMKSARGSSLLRAGRRLFLIPHSRTALLT